MWYVNRTSPSWKNKTFFDFFSWCHETGDSKMSNNNKLFSLIFGRNLRNLSNENIWFLKEMQFLFLINSRVGILKANFHFKQFVCIFLFFFLSLYYCKMWLFNRAWSNNNLLKSLLYRRWWWFRQVFVRPVFQRPWTRCRNISARSLISLQCLNSNSMVLYGIYIMRIWY